MANAKGGVKHDAVTPHRLPAAASGTPRPSVMWRTMPRCTATSGSTVTPTISTTYGAPVPGGYALVPGFGFEGRTCPQTRAPFFKTFLCDSVADDRPSFVRLGLSSAECIVIGDLTISMW